MQKAVTMAMAVGAVMLALYLESARASERHEHVTPTEGGSLALSEELAALLSEEMLAIEEGLDVLMRAMTAGDWPLAAETGERIETSYILAQRLTAGQREELSRVLPPRFKALDAAFHQSAGKLSDAAKVGDAELAVFHTYKLMEACIECHATYATARFPGFDAESASHDHH